MSTGADGDPAAIAEAVARLVADHPPERTPPEVFLGAQYDAGLAWIDFDEGFGGRGLDRTLQAIVDRAILAADGPLGFRINPFGYTMAGPTVHAHADDQQRQRLLRPMFTGAEPWCQLFSEPGAGSDLAAVATRGVPDDDYWVIDGQKVWTSFAHVASRGMLLARTDPTAAKHRGLSWFALDMGSPGVDVRPLRQITGEAEFNEVYLTGVRVPAADLIGGPGGGWGVALTTLMAERYTLGDAHLGSAPTAIDDALAGWRRHRAEAGRGTAVQRDLRARLWMEAEVIKLVNARAATKRAQGVTGPEGSVAKLISAEHNQRVYDFCLDLLGDDGMLYDDWSPTRPQLDDILGARDVRRMYLRSRANTIEGGTSEIQRNILAERVLAMPAEPRPADKDIPWNRRRP